MIRIALIGATGRMGRAILRIADESDAISIVAAVVSARSAQIGHAVRNSCGSGPAGLEYSADLDAAVLAADVVVDFSTPESAERTGFACVRARKPLLIGVTGLPDTFEARAREWSDSIATLIAPNTSLGVTVLLQLVEQAARALPASFDIRIVDAHHAGKKDAPSGTARALGEAARRGRGKALTPGEFSSIRAGDIVGDHAVLYAGPSEQLVLEHRATDRAVFAHGALEAAQWLSGQRPGSYTMADVLKNS